MAEGVLHLSVLIETMRREGYEFQIGQPQVIFKEKDGVKMEPIEHLVVDVPETFSGKVIELATQKKGELNVMEPKGNIQHLEFDIPARGLDRTKKQYADSYLRRSCDDSSIQRIPAIQR